MSWVRLDDGMPENLKIEALSDAAFRAYVTSICYAARNLTDGFITPKKAKEFAGRTKVIEELVPYLWECVEGGYLIHDYLDYNPTRNDVTEKRQEISAARSKAGSKGAAKRWQTDSKGDGKTMAPSRPDPLPDPDPDPQKPQDVVVVGARDMDEVGKVMASFATFGTVNEYTVECIEEAIDSYTLDWVKRAVKVAGISKASGDKPPWNYVETTLKRWKQRGSPDDAEAKELVTASASVFSPKKSLRFAG